MKDEGVGESRNLIFKGLASLGLYFPWHEGLSSGFSIKQNGFHLQCSGNHGKLLVVVLAVSADRINILKPFFFEATQAACLFRQETCVNRQVVKCGNYVSTSLLIINSGK